MQRSTHVTGCTLCVESIRDVERIGCQREDRPEMDFTGAVECRDPVEQCPRDGDRRRAAGRDVGGDLPAVAAARCAEEGWGSAARMSPLSQIGGLR